MRRAVLTVVICLVPGLLFAGLATAPAGAVGRSGRATAHLTSPTLGYDRIGVRRGDTWLLRENLAGGPADVSRFGPAGGQPVAGDTTGDGQVTLGVFLNGRWSLYPPGQPARQVRFGQPGDLAFLGDWTGSGRAGLGLFRRGRWFFRDLDGAATVRSLGYGQPGDRPVVGDWSGSGRTGIGVVRQRRWFERDTATAGGSDRFFDFGQVGDLPVAGDWDHDGVDTPGVFRAGTWFFHDRNGPGLNQQVRFGKAGDRPVVRRVQGLSSGVTHQVMRDATGPFLAHVATIDPAGPATPDAVLAGGHLGVLEPTSSLVTRSRGVLAINGDYALGSGRPVHVFAADGQLVQTEQVHGRGIGFDRSGHVVGMGFPQVAVAVTPPPAPSGSPLPSGSPSPTSGPYPVGPWNAGAPTGDTVAGFTYPGAPLEAPPSDACYTGLSPNGGLVVHPGGGMEQRLAVTGGRCGGAAPAVPGGTTVLAAVPGGAGAGFLHSLNNGDSVTVSTQLGFPGATDVLGGNPVLLANGVVQSQDVDGNGSFFDRNPRTAVGTTSDGRLLLVVVDGRQPGYSVGMTLRELAELMVRLGATDAINLDGGGSSTMWLNGLVANRPSDGVERAVSSALVVLPGADPASAGITVGAPAPNPTASPSGLPTVAPTPVPRLGAALVRAPGPVDPAWARIAADPGSTGGLAAALADRGVPLGPELRRTAAAFRAAHP